MKLKKLLYYIINIIGIALFIWIIASWLNILAHNTLGDNSYVYWTYNFFEVFF